MRVASFPQLLTRHHIERQRAGDPRRVPRGSQSSLAILPVQTRAVGIYIKKSYDPCKLVLLRCLKAQPNAAHHALASLALPSVRAQLLPALAEPAKPPLFITQNIDGLSPRALASLSEQLSPTELKLASERLIEMHGSIHKTRCLQCKAIKPTPDCPALRTAEDDPRERERAIPVEALPRCGGPQWDGSNRYGRCGGLLRPAVVWFGEAPEGMGEIAKELNWTDMLVVVGTSSTVSLRVRYVWVGKWVLSGLGWVGLGRCAPRRSMRRWSRSAGGGSRCSMLVGRRATRRRISCSWGRARRRCRRSWRLCPSCSMIVGWRPM